MKKRKELDALVSNGKCRGQKKTVSSGANCPSSQELLDGSDTSDTEELSIFRARKSLNGRKASRFYVACMPLCMLTLVTASVVGSAMLIWMHLGLKQEVDMLRNYFRKVESGTRKTPEEFHQIHSRLNFVEGNSTLNKESLMKMGETISALNKDIESLRKTTDNLSKSIAAAPQIETLPQTVQSLQQSVASIGSKITDLDTVVKEMKEQTSSISKNVQTKMDGMQKKVEILSNLSQAATSQPSVQSFTGDELEHLEGLVDDLNKTLYFKFQSASESLHHNHMVIHTLKNKSEVVDERLDVLERKIVEEIPAQINEIVPVKINETIDSLMSTKWNETYFKNMSVKDVLEQLDKYQELLTKNFNQSDKNGNRSIEEYAVIDHMRQQQQNISTQVEKLWQYVYQLRTEQTLTASQLKNISSTIQDIRQALNTSDATSYANTKDPKLSSTTPTYTAVTDSSQAPSKTSDKSLSTISL
uniref:EF-hand domain-containing protein n=1 Tax=Strigamia maritima TaxID=126957 RepID=T1IR35_STRMM